MCFACDAIDTLPDRLSNPELCWLIHSILKAYQIDPEKAKDMFEIIAINYAKTIPAGATIQ